MAVPGDESDDDDPVDEDAPQAQRTRTRSISGAPAKGRVATKDLPPMQRTRTRSISVAPSKGRVTTRELPPIDKPVTRTKLVIELDDGTELIDFLEHVVSALRANKGKKITLVIEE